MSARTKVTRARTALILDQPFFGALALRLKVQEDPSCKTAWIDGETFGYNPEYVDTLTHEQLTTLIAHEVMHCASGHPWRREQRDPKRWNEACDRAINPILVSAGFTLWGGAVYSPMDRGDAAEWIYDRMSKPQGDGEEEEEGQGSSPQGQTGDDKGEGSESEEDDQGDPFGELRDAPSASDPGTRESDWQAAVQQAARLAQSQGRLPGALQRFAQDAAAPRVNWRSVLHRFVSQAAAADYTWTRPSARYIPSGLYLPSLRNEELGPIVVVVDTSGSVDQVLLDQFAAELTAIVDELQPARVHVMYADSEVQRTDVFEREDPIVFDAVGGGGTAFAPAIEAAERLDEQPACLVYLTDLMGRFPAQAPDFPVLWASTHGERAPFGEVVVVR